MELQKNAKKNQIYAGLYHYIQENVVYCREEFEVFHNPHPLGLCFLAKQYIVSDSPAGQEKLHLSLEYRLDRDFTPLKVCIEKTLLQNSARETYHFDAQKKQLLYTFKEKERETKKTIIPHIPFTIATPFSCTSMLYLKSKKENIISPNYYHIVSSENHWSFKNTPIIQTLTLERINNDNDYSTSIAYKIYDKSSRSFIKVFLSPYSIIPHLIEAQEKIKIKIQYLKDFEKNKTIYFDTE